MKVPELLAPAGDLEKLAIVLTYGADAVYVSGKQWGLRAFSGNFTDEELKAAVKAVRDKNRKIYITVNIFPHNCDLQGIEKHLSFLGEIKPDGIIVSDLGVFSMARQIAPKIPVHISVQANNLNYREVLEWQKLGASRVILARELTMKEILEIREKAPGMELELFVHGAVCMSLSGRCLLSNYLTGRDANKGECAQSCRWSYRLVEEKRPGEYIPVMEDGKGAYIFNSKDLCCIEHLPRLIEAGIDSFKIEGRMKSVHYAAVTTAVYKKARDSYLAMPDKYVFDPALREELEKISHRQYFPGFYFAVANSANDNLRMKHNGINERSSNLSKQESNGRKPVDVYFDDNPIKQHYESSKYEATRKFLGYAEESSGKTAVFFVRNTFKTGDTAEIFTPEGNNYNAVIAGIKNTDGIEEPYAKQDKEYTVTFEMNGNIQKYSMLRMIV